MHNEHAFRILPTLHLPGLTAAESVVVEYTWLAMAIIMLVMILAVAGRKKIPLGLQNLIEVIVAFFEKNLLEIAGPRGVVYFPLVITVFFFIIVSNYMGLIPGCMAPTSSINTTAAWAIVVFIATQYAGFRAQGLKYIKHFLGPFPILAPFMFVMELISQLARPLSLSVRLFANLLAGELIISVLATGTALLLPVIWMTWESVITAPFQAFIFSLLTMIYIAGAVSGAGDEHE